MSIAILLDIVLAMILLEGIGVALLRLFRGVGPSPGAFACNLAAGFFLVLTARVAANPTASLGAIAACLSCALCAHLLDLKARWPR